MGVLSCPKFVVIAAGLVAVALAPTGCAKFLASSSSANSAANGYYSGARAGGAGGGYAARACPPDHGSAGSGRAGSGGSRGYSTQVVQPRTVQPTVTPASSSSSSRASRKSRSSFGFSSSRRGFVRARGFGGGRATGGRNLRRGH